MESPIGRMLHPPPTHTKTFFKSHILDVYLQGFLVVVKVLGQLKALVVEGEHSLEEGHHLKRHENLSQIEKFSK